MEKRVVRIKRITTVVLALVVCMAMVFTLMPEETHAASKLSAPKVTLSIVKDTGKIKVSWNKVNGAVSYKVYRSANGKDWSRISTTTGTSVVNKSAVSGKKYYYKVKAIASKTKNDSAFSAVKSKVCQIKTSVALKNGVPRLTWDKVNNAKKYKVYRAFAENGNYKLVTTTTNNSLTNGSAAKGLNIYYKVEAVNSAGKTIVKNTYPVKIKTPAPSGETFKTNYVKKTYATLYSLPVNNSKSITIPYMTKVKKGYAAISSSTGKWIRVKYNNKLYYCWQKTNVTTFTGTKSSFEYECANKYQQDIVDLATKICFEWKTVYEHDKSNGKPNADGTYGFDCSGFVKYVYNTTMQKYNPVYFMSSNLPTMVNTTSMYNQGHSTEFKATKVSLKNIKPGDVIFFSQKETNDHCGIYLGNNEFVHSSDFWKNSVCIMPLQDEFIDDLYCIRRYLPTNVKAINDEQTVVAGCKGYSDRNQSKAVYQFKKGEKVTVLYTDNNYNGDKGMAWVRTETGKNAIVLLKNIK